MSDYNTQALHMHMSYEDAMDAAHERNEAIFPVADFMPEAEGRLFQHVEYEALVSLITEHPDSVMRLLLNAANLGRMIDNWTPEQQEADKHTVDCFISHWVSEQAEFLQAEMVEAAR